MEKKEIFFDHPQKKEAARCFYTSDSCVIFTAESLLRQDGVNVKDAIDSLCQKYQLKLIVSPPPITNFTRPFGGGMGTSKSGEVAIQLMFPRPVSEQAMQDTMTGILQLSWGEIAWIKPPAPEPETVEQNLGKGKLFINGKEAGTVTDVKLDVPWATPKSPISKNLILMGNADVFTGVPTQAEVKRLAKEAKQAQEFQRELVVIEIDPLMDRDW